MKNKSTHMSEYEIIMADQEWRYTQQCTEYVCTVGSSVVLRWTDYSVCASPYLPQRNGDTGTVVSHNSRTSYSRILLDNPRLHGNPELDVFYEHLVPVTPPACLYTLY
tara:strand:+ start:584 stop:907 length:324 start_codon:yes stop_codon:yes gene_type:complete